MISGISKLLKSQIYTQALVIFVIIKRQNFRRVYALISQDQVELYRVA